MKAVLIQLAVCDGETPQQRMERVCNRLEQLTDTDLVLLPEMWRTGFSAFDAYLTESEPLCGATTQTLAEYAKRRKTNLLTGSFVERRDGHCYNTMALIDRTGRIADTYQKVHLFGFESRERDILTAGNRYVTAQTDCGSIGMATCYDLRFPEQFRAMVDRGAQLFAVTAAWPMVRLEHWRLFCQARALENQCFLLACNHAGTHCGVQGAGHSMIVDPNGVILAEAGAEEQVLTAEIDIEQVAQARRNFSALHDRVNLSGEK